MEDNLMKKILFAVLLILATLMCISCGEEKIDTGNFTVEFDKKNNTATITGYTAKDESITIPEKFGKYTVTTIGRNAFKENYDVSEIVFPATLKTIEASAFELCVSLKEVTLPSSLEKLGNTAFASCRKLEKVSIPSNVSEIGICAFTGCIALDEITVDEANAAYSSDIDGVLFNKDKTILIQYPLGSSLVEYEIPEETTEISSYAFEKTKKLESIIAPSSLKTVGSYAFQASSVRKVKFESVETIDNFAFNESKLQYAELGNTLKKIGDSAFGWCTSLSNVNLPASVETIGTSAFYMCTAIDCYLVDKDNKNYATDEHGVLFNKDMTILLYYPNARELHEYTVPNTVTKISTRAFSPSLNLSKVTIPDSVEIIEEYAFAQCANLKDVIYEGTQPQSIAENAFEK